MEDRILEPKIMNRLILIGNGFDLAHGLKTSYKDFLTDYLFCCINSFYKNKEYKDPLLEISYVHSGTVFAPKTVESSFQILIDEIKMFETSKLISVKYKSVFFKDLITNFVDLNWVDFENEYFNALKKCKSNSEFNYHNVISLNNEFEFIKGKFEQYLYQLQGLVGKVPEIYKFANIFCEDIKASEIVTYSLEKDVKPNRLYVLNFNYTSTVTESYNRCNRNFNIDVNFIHGELCQSDNPIIFGFGDEYDKDYKEFENHKNNSLFKHIKSFNYFKTRNYHDLVRFTDNDDFQVYIIGHSCGLSDRTMLKQIFEHEKCKSIKIFHYNRTDGTNDYTEKTYEIARHFTDKGLMRKKIVPFNKFDCMPQKKVK